MPDFILVFVYVDLNPRERGFNQTNRRVGTRRLRTANLCRCVHASGRIPSPATKIKPGECPILFFIKTCFRFFQIVYVYIRLLFYVHRRLFRNIYAGHRGAILQNHRPSVFSGIAKHVSGAGRCPTRYLIHMIHHDRSGIPVCASSHDWRTVLFDWRPLLYNQMAKLLCVWRVKTVTGLSCDQTVCACI